MEFIHEFGINPYLLVAQIINFLIIAYLLKRFAYKPVLELLEKRKKTIELGMQQAEQSQKLLEQASEKETALLKNAQISAKKLLEEAKKQNDLLLKQTEESAKKRTEQMLSDAKEHIAFETKQAEKRLEKHITELAIAFLEKAVAELFSKKDQKEVLEKAMKKIKEKK